jgi:hypothetical protein
MWNYRAKWYFIGIELRIDTGTLDALERDYRMVDDCLIRMINIWLRRRSPRPTRQMIKVALQSIVQSKHVSNAALPGS